MAKTMDDALLEQKLSSEDIFDGTLLHVRRDMVRLPDGGESVREWIKHPGASAVIPLTEDGQIILVRQYRYPVQCVTLEIPAGKLDSPDEDPLVCAKRELSEETGYTAEHFTELTTIATTVGFSNEKIHIYAASGLKPGKQHTDEDEFINVVRLSLDEALRLVERGEIIDAKSAVAILMLARRQHI